MQYGMAESFSAMVTLSFGSFAVAGAHIAYVGCRLEWLTSPAAFRTPTPYTVVLSISSMDSSAAVPHYMLLCIGVIRGKPGVGFFSTWTSQRCANQSEIPEDPLRLSRLASHYYVGMKQLASSYIVYVLALVSPFPRPPRQASRKSPK